LKFGNKPKPQIQVDSDPLKDVSMMHTDIVGCNMVEATIDVVENLFVEAEVEAKTEVAECQMVDITKYAKHVKEIAPEPRFDEKLKTAYPTAEEELIDILNRCKLKNSEVMLCPRCSDVFEKEATKGLEGYIPKPKKMGKWSGDHRPTFSFTKSYITFINNSSTTNFVNQSGQGKTLVPYAPNQKWVQPTHTNVQHGKNDMMKRNTSVMDNSKNGTANESRKFAYSNYKGKNPMTRTHWRRYQRFKKGISISLEHEKERLSLPLVKENPNKDNELGSGFTDSEPDIDVICNLVSILPVEYDMISEVDDSKEEFDPKGMGEYQPMCYFVNDGSEDNQKAIFEHLDDSMKSHLKPLLIQAKVDEVSINKVLVGGGAAVNLMPQSLLKRIGKTDKDLKPHDVILSNYEGKAGHSLGALQVSLTVGIVVRPTLFMVVPSKANFNLLLRSEWIHGIGIVPSSMHQRISTWGDDGIVENIEADQSYFPAEENQIARKTFDKNLENIAPCSFAKLDDANQADASSVKLHPTHGFMWERETSDTEFYMEDLNSLTLGNDEDDHHI